MTHNTENGSIYLENGPEYKKTGPVYGENGPPAGPALYAKNEQLTENQFNSSSGSSYVPRYWNTSTVDARKSVDLYNNNNVKTVEDLYGLSDDEPIKAIENNGGFNSRNIEDFNAEQNVKSAHKKLNTKNSVNAVRNVKIRQSKTTDLFLYGDRVMVNAMTMAQDSDDRKYGSQAETDNVDLKKNGSIVDLSTEFSTDLSMDCSNNNQKYISKTGEENSLTDVGHLTNNPRNANTSDYLNKNEDNSEPYVCLENSRKTHCLKSESANSFVNEPPTFLPIENCEYLLNKPNSETKSASTNRSISPNSQENFQATKLTDYPLKVSTEQFLQNDQLKDTPINIQTNHREIIQHCNAFTPNNQQNNTCINNNTQKSNPVETPNFTPNYELKNTPTNTQNSNRIEVQNFVPNYQKQKILSRDQTQNREKVSLNNPPEARNSAQFLPHNYQSFLPINGTNFLPNDKQNFLPDDKKNIFSDDYEKTLPMDQRNLHNYSQYLNSLYEYRSAWPINVNSPVNQSGRYNSNVFQSRPGSAFCKVSRNTDSQEKKLSSDNIAEHSRKSDDKNYTNYSENSSKDEKATLYQAADTKRRMTTAQPISQSKMHLYRVLQRANLLSYYETFIAQGGDDVQQLCEAGEEEFLEIMALVGMASKPLHVRRLQKTLQDWITNPASFNSDRVSTTPTPGSISATAQQQYTPTSQQQLNNNNNQTWSGSSPSSISPPAPDSQDTKPARSSTSPILAASLLDEQIAAIAGAAERLARNLPIFAPKDLNPKKGFNREVMEVMMLTDDDLDRLEKLRKYAAIYGRFDSKRKNDRPMSLHELSVNEASAQLCRFVPALLTRREDLFPLARQVVRDSGYQYSKGHSSSQWRTEPQTPPNKRIKLDNSFNSWLIDQLQRPVKTDHNGNKQHQIREISLEIKDVRDKMNSVRSLIQDAKERNDTEALNLLQQKIDTLTSRQLILLSELEEFTALPDSAPKQKPSSNGTPDDDELSDSSNMPSGASSPAPPPAPTPTVIEPTNLSKRTPVGPVLQRPPPNTESEVNLFEEGLRIAQQYGLADFAEELKELQQKTGEDDPVSESGAVRGRINEGLRRNFDRHHPSGEMVRNMMLNRGAGVGNQLAGMKHQSMVPLSLSVANSHGIPLNLHAISSHAVPLSLRTMNSHVPLNLNASASHVSSVPLSLSGVNSSVPLNLNASHVNTVPLNLNAMNTNVPGHGPLGHGALPFSAIPLSLSTVPLSLGSTPVTHSAVSNAIPLIHSDVVMKPNTPPVNSTNTSSMHQSAFSKLDVPLNLNISPNSSSIHDVPINRISPHTVSPNPDIRKKIHAMREKSTDAMKNSSWHQSKSAKRVTDKGVIYDVPSSVLRGLVAARSGINAAMGINATDMGVRSNDQAQNLTKRDETMNRESNDRLSDQTMDKNCDTDIEVQNFSRAGLDAEKPDNPSIYTKTDGLIVKVDGHSAKEDEIRVHSPKNNQKIHSPNTTIESFETEKSPVKPNSRVYTSTSLNSTVTMHTVKNLSPTSISIHSMNTRKAREASK